MRLPSGSVTTNSLSPYGRSSTGLKPAAPRLLSCFHSRSASGTSTNAAPAIHRVRPAGEVQLDTAEVPARKDQLHPARHHFILQTYLRAWSDAEGKVAVRRREHIAQTTFASDLAEFTEERPPSRDIVHRFIQERHGHSPEDAEVEAAWSLATFQIMQGSLRSFDEAFSNSMGVATTQLAPLLGELHWRVETAEAPILWTSDRPVMP
jgi:hypothetical protein